MKITKAKLKQIIKEEISDIFEDQEWGMDKGDESKTHPGELDYDNTGMNTVEDALEKVLPTIQDAYASLTDEETQAQFEEHLLKNIQLYIKKWQAGRKGLPDKSDQFVHSPSGERIDVSGGDFSPTGTGGEGGWGSYPHSKEYKI